MQQLTIFSLKNPAVILIFVLMVAIGGYFSASQLKQEMMPDISIPIVAVVAVYPGAGPEDVLKHITEPFEKALKSIPGVKNVYSTSAESVSSVVAEFDYKAEMDEVERKAQDSIKKIKLPQGAQEPQILRMRFGSFPVLKIGISNKTISTFELEKNVGEVIIPALLGIEGISQAQLASETEKSLLIKMIPEELKNKRLTFQNVKQQLQASHLSMPIGSISMNGSTRPVRVTGSISSLDELKNLCIPIYPEQQEVVSTALTQMGEGINSLGSAVGELGQAMGKMNEGFTGLSQNMGGQMALLAAIQDLQNRLLSLKIAMIEANSTLQNPAATEQEKSAASVAIQQLSAQIPVLESALSQTQNQLSQIQAGMSQGIEKPAQPSSLQKSLIDKQEIPLSSSEQAKIDFVTLGEIAEVSIDEGYAEALSRINGKPSVLIDVIKNQDANTVDVVNSSKDTVESLIGKLPAGTKISYFYDQSTSVKNSIKGIRNEGIIGAIFAFLVILFFLRNLRITLISVVSIPLSVIAALLFMKQVGLSLNIMTLGGLAVAIGRVVDDSIVVIENIYRQLQSNNLKTSELILTGTKEVTSAITSSTFTTVAVFVPLGMVTGIVGKFFVPFALTVFIALMASLVVALTIVPLMAKFLMLKSKVASDSKLTGGWLVRAYRSTLNWSLDRKWVILPLVLILLLGSLALLPLIGTSFIPEPKEKIVQIDVEMPPGTSLGSTNKKIAEIENIVGDHEYVVEYQTSVGSPKGSLGASGEIRGENVGSIVVKLDSKANVISIIEDFKEKTGQIAGEAKINIYKASTSGLSDANKLEISVYGDSFDDIKKGSDLLISELSKIDILENISSNISESKPEVSIAVDQKKASELGLSAAQIAMTVRQLLSEEPIYTLKLNKEELNVKLGLKLDPLTRLEDIRSLEITSPLGKTIKLSEIATVSEAPGPVSIYRQDGKEFALISAAMNSKDLGGVSRQIENKIKELTLPKGVSVKVGGSVEQMKDSFRQIGIAMVVAVLAVYLVMVIAFGEALAPFTILFSLPLAITGGLVGLLVTDQPLNMPAMIGFLMLIGIVVTNAIVLVDRIKQKTSPGMNVRDAIIEAGQVRMRPILMTAITTICALFPMALGMSKGAFMSQSLAVVVIGGLTTSTFLTLIVVPVIYELLTKIKASWTASLK